MSFQFSLGFSAKWFLIAQTDNREAAGKKKKKNPRQLANNEMNKKSCIG